MGIAKIAVYPTLAITVLYKWQSIRVDENLQWLWIEYVYPENTDHSKNNHPVLTESTDRIQGSHLK